MGDVLPADDVYIGPSDYVPWLTDRKWAHIRLEGEAFGDVPLSFEAKLEVWDSPNSAGIVTDAVRCCKLAFNHGVGGPLVGPSAYLMKSPPEQLPDPVARDADREVHRRVRRSAEAAGPAEGTRRDDRGAGLGPGWLHAPRPRRGAVSLLLASGRRRYTSRGGLGARREHLPAAVVADRVEPALRVEPLTEIAVRYDHALLAV